MRIGELKMYNTLETYYVYQITPYDLNESYDNYCI